MAALGELRTLRCLHLKDQQTRDEHMASLGKLTGLTSLYLEGCCLGDDGMAALGGLRALRTLCISSSRDADSRLDVLVTNAGLETLAALPNLQALDLDCCSHVEGHGLLGLTGLTSLGLSKLGGLSREAMKAVLIKLTALTGLDLLDCPQLLGHHGMDLWTVRCPALRSLRLCCMLSAELQGNVFMLDPAFLTHCPNLTELNLGQSSFIHNGSVVKLAALFRAGRLTNLRKLWLSACDSGDDPHFGPGSNDNLTDEGLMHLAGVSSLQSLCLAWNTRITCRGLAHLVAPTPGLASRAGLTQLRELDLTSCDSIGDMGVSWLAMHISSLQVLSLSDCNVSDLCMPHLSRLRRLRELSLKGCRDISDKGLVHLSGLGALQELHLGMAFGDEMYVYEQSNISDAGLALLGRAAAALRVLSLEGRQTITQHGVQQLVLALPSLTALDVRHTQVPHGFAQQMDRPRKLVIKTGKRDLAGDCLSDVFDLVARPMYKHCINPPHDWTGACHEVPCPCNNVWEKVVGGQPFIG